MTTTKEYVTVCFVPKSAEISIQRAVFGCDWSIAPAGARDVVGGTRIVEIDGMESLVYPAWVPKKVIDQQMSTAVPLEGVSMAIGSTGKSKHVVYALVRFEGELQADHVEWVKTKLGEQRPKPKVSYDQLVTIFKKHPTLLGAWDGKKNLDGKQAPVFLELLVEPIEEKEKEAAKETAKAARV